MVDRKLSNSPFYSYLGSFTRGVYSLIQFCGIQGQGVASRGQ